MVMARMQQVFGRFSRPTYYKHRIRTVEGGAGALMISRGLSRAYDKWWKYAVSSWNAEGFLSSAYDKRTFGSRMECGGEVEGILEGSDRLWTQKSCIADAEGGGEWGFHVGAERSGAETQGNSDWNFLANLIDLWNPDDP
jgi:hypothetical protein